VTTDYRTRRDEVVDVAASKVESPTIREDVRSDRPSPSVPAQRAAPSEPSGRTFGPKAIVTRATRLLSRSWVVEISVIVVLVIAYNIIRALPRPHEVAAFTHAQQILSLEGPVFGWIEVPLNQWMAGAPVVAVAACYFYAALHYAATPLVLFRSRRQGGWQYWRGYWSLVIASGIALVVYALYPVAPPRLMPDIDIVDVMRSFSQYGWWGAAASAPRGIGDATNQFAALPSMHFGWALWCAIQMWGFGSRFWRVLALLYPTLLTIVVIGTGNHFLIDVAAGGVCVLAALGIVYGVRTLVERVQRNDAAKAAA
jgi:PAP2 superfamily